MDHDKSLREANNQNERINIIAGAIEDDSVHTLSEARPLEYLMGLMKSDPEKLAVIIAKDMGLTVSEIRAMNPTEQYKLKQEWKNKLYKEMSEAFNRAFPVSGFPAGGKMEYRSITPQQRLDMTDISKSDET